MAEVNVKRVKSSEIEFKDRLVAVNRVTKVTKGGRTFSFSAIVVIGDEKGVVGYGLGKAKEVTAYDIPVPYLDKEFDVALIGKKQKWYDHKVSVSQPEAK